MNLWHDVPLGEGAPEEFNTIIEIPRGSLNKYEIDKETGLIALDRVMHTAQVYPFDYGFAPQTYWEDNDPLDVVILTTEPLHPGVVVRTRPVAIMNMIDDGDADDKIIGVPTDDPRWEGVQDLTDLNSHMPKVIKHFFETYKYLQEKEVKVEGFSSKKEAIKAIEKSVKLYKEKFGK